MKFTSIIVSTLVAVAVAQSNNTTATNSTSDLTPQQECINNSKCNGEVGCIAKCVGVPNPTPEQVNKTQTCSEGCNQTDTQKKSECIQQCIASNYLTHTDSNSSKANNTKDDSNKKNGSSNGTGSFAFVANQPCYFGLALAVVGLSAFSN